MTPLGLLHVTKLDHEQRLRFIDTLLFCKRVELHFKLMRYDFHLPPEGLDSLQYVLGGVGEGKKEEVVTCQGRQQKALVYTCTMQQQPLQQKRP